MSLKHLIPSVFFTLISVCCGTCRCFADWQACNKAIYVTKNYDDALRICKADAESGSEGAAISQVYLGLIYSLGLGVRQDLVESFKWVSLSANSGCTWGMYLVGVAYSSGRGVNQDYKRAVEWLSLAAQLDYSEAQSLLCWHYLQGKGVHKDYIKAMEWCTLAAEQGNSTAQFYLGYMYGVRGVPQDFVLAYKWANLAAAKDFPGSDTLRDLITTRMTPAEITEAQKMSREWKPRKQNPKVIAPQ